MSAALVGWLTIQHNFKDDLESSIYVLLWVIIMYSEVSDRERSEAFLIQTLDSQPCKTSGAKADFLKGRTFLSNVTFPGRLALHTLIDRLARVFAVRYKDKPTPTQRMHTEKLRILAQSDPTFIAVYKDSIAYDYDQRISDLESRGHDMIIDLFNDALHDRSQWLAHDSPVKQPLFTKPPPLHALVTKTSWSSLWEHHDKVTGGVF